jgi:hypothetical protein
MKRVTILERRARHTVQTRSPQPSCLRRGCVTFFALAARAAVRSPRLPRRRQRSSQYPRWMSPRRRHRPKQTSSSAQIPHLFVSGARGVGFKRSHQHRDLSGQRLLARSKRDAAGQAGAQRELLGHVDIGDLDHKDQIGVALQALQAEGLRFDGGKLLAQCDTRAWS